MHLKPYNFQCANALWVHKLSGRTVCVTSVEVHIFISGVYTCTCKVKTQKKNQKNLVLGSNSWKHTIDGLKLIHCDQMSVVGSLEI